MELFRHFSCMFVCSSQGGLSGLISGLIAALCVSLGEVISPSPPEMTRPLPLSTAGCNFTTTPQLNWTTTALPQATSLVFTTAEQSSEDMWACGQTVGQSYTLFDSYWGYNTLNSYTIKDINYTILTCRRPGRRGKDCFRSFCALQQKLNSHHTKARKDLDHLIPDENLFLTSQNMMTSQNNKTFKPRWTGPRSFTKMSKLTKKNKTYKGSSQVIMGWPQDTAWWPFCVKQ